MSYGRSGRDLTGLAEALDSISQRSNLVFLDLTILFPLQSNPHNAPELTGHPFWTHLSTILRKPEYRSVRRVTMVLTVHEKVRMWEGLRINTVAEFQKQMVKTLRPLLNMSSLHLKLKVQGFR